jgi:hypothetical protein
MSRWSSTGCRRVPAIRTLNATLNNLPTQLTSFLGRTASSRN